MNSNFRADELVKVQKKQYPVVGGRLRLAHEENKNLSITTEIIPGVKVIDQGQKIDIKVVE